MKEFQWPVRVYYEDTDNSGLVYHTNYLKFMERARTEMLRSIGFEQDVLIKQENIIFVVRSINIDFVKPASFNDLLVISIKIGRLGKASIVFEQTVKIQGEENVLCKADVKVACVDASLLRPCSIPKTIIGKLNYAG